MSARNREDLRFRKLGPADRGAVSRIAGSAFQGSAFYRRALGLGERGFERYWDAFFELSLSDPAAVVFGLEWKGAIAAAVAIAFEGFPRTSRAVRFVWRLFRGIGPGGLLRYLRFVRAYSRVMHRPAAERRIEACAFWFFADPRSGRTGLGAVLARRAMEVMRAEGKFLITAFIDAGDRSLARYYQRLGFSVSPPFPFAGMQAARIELRLEPPPAGTDVEDHPA